MSVSFYDPSNPLKYDEDYEPVGGGPEANFANANARMILEVLGLIDDTQSLYGEISAENMIAAINRARVSVNCFCDENHKDYLLAALSDIESVAEMSLNHSKNVVWG